MTDDELNTLLEVLRGGTAIGRIGHGEAEYVLRYMESQGWKITPPAAQPKAVA
jgi:hypothetical protein